MVGGRGGEGNKWVGVVRWEVGGSEGVLEVVGGVAGGEDGM